MKEDIEQAVLEMIKKSGVELGEGELESVIDASFNTASEHISNALTVNQLVGGSNPPTIATTVRVFGRQQGRRALWLFATDLIP